MADKYLNLDPATGGTRETEASAASAGAADAGRVTALNVFGKIDDTMLPSGVGADTKTFLAGEALAAGDLVYVYNDAGTARVRKAIAASGGNAAMGFVTAAVANNATATVHFSGENAFATALTSGARVYLSDVTAGRVVSAQVAGAGKLHQFIGRATSPTEFRFEPSDAITLAA